MTHIIKPLGDSVVFEFVELTKNGFFRGQTTNWGFSLENVEDYDAGRSRWGKVLHVGPDATQVKEGDYILIEKQKWTLSIEVDNVTMWRTKEEYIVAVTDDISKIQE